MPSSCYQHAIIMSSACHPHAIRLPSPATGLKPYTKACDRSRRRRSHTCEPGGAARAVLSTCMRSLTSSAESLPVGGPAVDHQVVHAGIGPKPLPPVLFDGTLDGARVELGQAAHLWGEARGGRRGERLHAARESSSGRLPTCGERREVNGRRGERLHAAREGELGASCAPDAPPPAPPRRCWWRPRRRRSPPPQRARRPRRRVGPCANRSWGRGALYSSPRQSPRGRPTCGEKRRREGVVVSTCMQASSAEVIRGRLTACNRSSSEVIRGHPRSSVVISGRLTACNRSSSAPPPPQAPAGHHRLPHHRRRRRHHRRRCR